VRTGAAQTLRRTFARRATDTVHSGSEPGVPLDFAPRGRFVPLHGTCPVAHMITGRRHRGSIQ